MTNLIKIPIMDGKFEVRFPEKCVYCGKSQEIIVPITASRSSGSQYNRIHKRATFQVPYCQEHSRSNKTYRTWLSVLFFTCLAFSCAAQLIISFALDLQETFQICVLGPTLALVFAFLVGNLGVRKVWSRFDKTFAELPGSWVDGGLGLSMMMGGDVVGFSFSNQAIAQEFAQMNGLSVEFTNG
jgi:hypothetical protein